MSSRVPSPARLRRFGARLAERFGRSRDPLTRLADRYGTDNGTALAGHQYTRIYSELFEPWRDRPIRLLEIGLNGAWPQRLG